MLHKLTDSAKVCLLPEICFCLTRRRNISVGVSVKCKPSLSENGTKHVRNHRVVPIRKFLCASTRATCKYAHFN